MVEIRGHLHVSGGWRRVPSLRSLTMKAGEVGAQRGGPGTRWRGDRRGVTPSILEDAWWSRTPGERRCCNARAGTHAPLETQIRQAPAWEQQREGWEQPLLRARVAKESADDLGSRRGCLHVGGIGWLHRAAGGVYSLEMLGFSGVFSPVKQFSEHFPWNILTLEFKISAADTQGVEREEPKLAAGNCACPRRCRWALGQAVQ